MRWIRVCDQHSVLTIYIHFVWNVFEWRKQRSVKKKKGFKKKINSRHFLIVLKRSNLTLFQITLIHSEAYILMCVGLHVCFMYRTSFVIKGLSQTLNGNWFCCLQHSCVAEYARNGGYIIICHWGTLSVLENVSVVGVYPPCITCMPGGIVVDD